MAITTKIQLKDSLAKIYCTYGVQQGFPYIIYKGTRHNVGNTLNLQGIYEAAVAIRESVEANAAARLKEQQERAALRREEERRDRAAQAAKSEQERTELAGWAKAFLSNQVMNGEQHYRARGFFVRAYSKVEHCEAAIRDFQVGMVLNPKYAFENGREMFELTAQLPIALDILLALKHHTSLERGTELKSLEEIHALCLKEFNERLVRKAKYIHSKSTCATTNLMADYELSALATVVDPLGW